MLESSSCPVCSDALPPAFKKKMLATNRPRARLGCGPGDHAVAREYRREGARPPGWCWERGRGGERAGRGHEARAAVPLSYSLLPTTRSRRGLETFASLLRVSHIVLLLLENQFFLFCFVLQCHILPCSRFNFLIEKKMYYGCLFFFLNVIGFDLM